jgi:hypothetical protein
MSIIAFGSLVVLILCTSIYQIRKLSEVHVLVNSRLSLALEEIAGLKRVVSAQQTQLDREN